MMGLSLNDAMSLMIFSVKAPATAATPWFEKKEDRETQSQLLTDHQANAAKFLDHLASNENNN